MKDIDYVLDFAVHLGREMLLAGANLERVNTTMEIICKQYNLHEVSVFSLSSSVSLSAKNNDGDTHIRQLAVPAAGIHLTKLRKLNTLSYKVCNEKIEPSQLEDMLYSALMVPSYSEWIEMLGFVIATVSLCRIFGGGLTELLVIAISTVAVYWLNRFLAKAKLNRIITNIINMFFTTSITFLAVYTHFAEDIMSMLTAMSLMFIPGVPLVNSIRNIFCGNEMNGILELLKVILEVLTICAGVYISYFVFGRWFTW